MCPTVLSEDKGRESGFRTKVKTKEKKAHSAVVYVFDIQKMMFFIPLC